MGAGEIPEAHGITHAGKLAVRTNRRGERDAARRSVRRFVIRDLIMAAPASGLIALQK